MKTVFFVGGDAIIVDGDGLVAYQAIFDILKVDYPLYAEKCEREAELHEGNEDGSVFSPAQCLRSFVDDFGVYAAYSVGSIKGKYYC